MAEERQIRFGVFRFEPDNARLWCGSEVLRVSPKALAVLHYLVEQVGHLVTKEELFQAVWPGVVVGDAALTICIGELRKVLGERATAPQYIETVHKRGYRFIGTVVSSQQSVGSSPSSSLASSPQPLAPSLVGRETELAQLHGWLEKAVNGERQLVFVTGEPGMGKTTLIDAFVSGVREPASPEEDQKSKGKTQKAKVSETQSSALSPQSLSVQSPNPQAQILLPWISRGQCLDLHGVGEPYMPVLDALSRLGREAGGERLRTVLRQYAPTWLAQMPTVLSADELIALQPKVQGATRERMLREMAEALEALTAEQPLVLVLEDLHWSDPSTLDLLAMMARRREPARLLVIGTYRPAEMLANTHPLRTVTQELLGHQQCHELQLKGLSQAAIEEYLATRFLVQVLPTRLAQVFQQRTGGNPLFVVNLVDELVRQGVLTEGEGGWMVHGDIDELVQQVPESSRQLIAAQMARVSGTTQQTLAAASVAGAVFSAAAVAAALEAPVTAVETRCEEVAQQQLFIQRAGIEAWPDGTTAARYGFRHALYQELWHEQGTVTQRQEWHQRIGLRKELAYNGRAAEIAAELALHFEQGQEPQRAIQYYQHAAGTATQRLAYQEAIAHFTAALSLLKTLPETAARHQQELHLQLSLHWRLARSKGEAAPELDAVAARARTLLQWSEDLPQLFGAVFALFDFYLVRVELSSVRFFAEYALRLARRFPDRPLLGLAYFMLGCPDVLAGEFLSARTVLEQAMAAYTQPPPEDSTLEDSTLWETGLCCFPFAAWTLWQLGFPDQALCRASETITKARLCGARFIEAYGLNTLASVQVLRGDVAAVRTHAAAAQQLADAHGFAPMREMGRVYQGWALSRQADAYEGIVQLRQSIADLRSTSGITFRTYYLALLAEAYGRTGQREEGLSVLVEALALVDKTGERFYEAELYRLKGELLLAQESREQGARSKRQKSENPNPTSQSPEPHSEAEACFLKAIDIARKQQAKSLELRATASLARLWQSQGKQREAHQMLAEIYGWFTEGFATKDLQEAKALLEELS